MGALRMPLYLSCYRYRKNTQNCFFFKYRYDYNDRSMFSSDVYLTKKCFHIISIASRAELKDTEKNTYIGVALSLYLYTLTSHIYNNNNIRHKNREFHCPVGR